EQAFIVEDHVHKVRGFVACQCAECAEVHQHRAVAIKDDDALLRQAQGQAEAHGRSQPHGVLQIKEVGPVAERVQLGGNCAHDGYDDAVLETVVDGAQTFQALHQASSHINSRVSSSATGCRLL